MAPRLDELENSLATWINEKRSGETPFRHRE